MVWCGVEGYLDGGADEAVVLLRAVADGQLAARAQAVHAALLLRRRPRAAAAPAALYDHRQI